MNEQAVSLPEPLSRAGVTLWQVALDTPVATTVRVAANVLGPHELQRWQAFRCPQAAAAYAALRVSLQRLLWRCFGLDICGQSLAYGAHGKPALPTGGPPWFNLSHSGTTGCIALSQHAEVGVDIERHDRQGPALPHTFSDVFTVRERAHIRQAGAAGFYRIWTRKEAVLKALGLGFATDARAICVAPPAVESRAGVCCATTRLWSIDTVAACSVAVACVSPDG